MENENQPVGNLHTYFCEVSEIWIAFNQKGMSTQMREALLAPYRKMVSKLPPSGLHA